MLANSLFLIAHFHNVIIGGVLFDAMAGYNYWVPKTFGFRLTNVGARHRFSLTALVRQAALCRAQVLRLIATVPPGRPAPQSDMVRYPVTRAPGSCVVRLEVRL